MRTLQLTLQEALEASKALANENRMEIIRQLTSGPKNVNDISELLKIPFSTAAANIKILENAGLITTEIVPGRGNQKVSSKRYDRIIIDLEEQKPITEDIITYELEVGEYVNCEVEPSCGLLSADGIIHIIDDPRSFFEPARKNAQLVWFRSGLIEYHFPNRIPYGTDVDELSFSVELCSEAPYHNEDWPSDITCWINDSEIGYWTSPGDFGGERGFLTPNWWETHNTQFGVLKYWKINKEGSFIDGVKISSTTIDELKLQEKPFISLKLGVKQDAKNQGGLNLFGSKFGNYEQGIIMKINYSQIESKINSK
ncbi:ArsR/SmtB family transcription factor [Lederbergia panacisoli]|uniref:ArsR/SmtB family transcription factor n=1 Tax=Lederbergia panacisoli TaxID=1255251 RepID=UPI00214AF579|nr:helix-turn-helix domain-containing protein [Lederbergia panacisoli]MCR2823867.1 helix-turn-helix domain-containing protein [Lederbergia panacisoli]